MLLHCWSDLISGFCEWGVTFHARDCLVVLVLTVQFCTQQKIVVCPLIEITSHHRNSKSCWYLHYTLYSLSILCPTNTAQHPQALCWWEQNWEDLTPAIALTHAVCHPKHSTFICNRSKKTTMYLHTLKNSRSYNQLSKQLVLLWWMMAKKKYVRFWSLKSNKQNNLKWITNCRHPTPFTPDS